MKILGKMVLGIGGMSCLGYLLRKSEDKLMEEKEKKDREYSNLVTDNATYLSTIRQMEEEKRQMEKEKDTALCRIDALVKDTAKLKTENEMLRKENYAIKSKTTQKKPVTQKKSITQLGQKVIKWRAKHPQGTKQECSKVLRCSVSTVKRWWDYHE